MIADEIKTQITDAMKSGDKVRLSTLKLLSSALTNAEIAKKREKLTEDEELEVVRFEAKKRRDAIEGLKQAQGNLSKINQSKEDIEKQLEKEKEELTILEEYLPKGLSDAEVKKIVSTSIEQTGASGMADFGKAMGAAMGQVKGRADGNRVSKEVRNQLK